MLILCIYVMHHKLHDMYILRRENFVSSVFISFMAFGDAYRLMDIDDKSHAILVSKDRPSTDNTLPLDNN